MWCFTSSAALRERLIKACNNVERSSPKRGRDGRVPPVCPPRRTAGLARSRHRRYRREGCNGFFPWDSPLLHGRESSFAVRHRLLVVGEHDPGIFVLHLPYREIRVDALRDDHRRSFGGLNECFSHILAVGEAALVCIRKCGLCSVEQFEFHG